MSELYIFRFYIDMTVQFLQKGHWSPEYISVQLISAWVYTLPKQIEIDVVRTLQPFSTRGAIDDLRRLLIQPNSLALQCHLIISLAKYQMPVVGLFNCTRHALFSAWTGPWMTCGVAFLPISNSFRLQPVQHTRIWTKGATEHSHLSISQHLNSFYSYINFAFFLLWSILDLLINNAPPVNQGFLVFADLSLNLHEFQMGSRNFAPKSSCLCNSCSSS